MVRVHTNIVRQKLGLRIVFLLKLVKVALPLLWVHEAVQDDLHEAPCFGPFLRQCRHQVVTKYN